MSFISVNTEALKDLEKRFGTLSQKLGQTESSLKSIRNNLDMEIKNRNGIDSKLQNLLKELDEEEKVLNQIKQFLVKTIKQYQDIEKSVQIKVNEINGDIKPKKNIFSKILDAVTSSIKKRAEIILKIILLPVIIGSPVIGDTVIKGVRDILSKNGNEVNNKPAEKEKGKNETNPIPPLSGILSYNPNVYSEDVLKMQKRLNEIYAGVSGYKKIKEDGYFGPETLAAVNRYKEEHGLWNFGEYEGKVGETTWNHMFSLNIGGKDSQQGTNTTTAQTNNRVSVNNNGTIGGLGGSNPYDIYENRYNMVCQNAQEFLMKLGYNVGKTGADGKWGPNTKAAVNSFQRDNNLPETLYLDERTYNLLFEKWMQAGGDISDFWAERVNTWISPLKGSCTMDLEIDGRGFGASRSNGTRAHAGIDYLAEPGREVVAVTSGTVRYVDKNFYAGTQAIDVENDDGTWVRYTEILVNSNISVGTRLKQGDVVGIVIPNNESGSSMLHFEVYQGIDKKGNDLSGYLTDRSNTAYDYVDGTKYQRRRDLIDPTGSRYLTVLSNSPATGPSITSDLYKNVDVSGLGAPVSSVEELRKLSELDVLARTIYGECCSGAGDYGQESVAWTLINRKNSGSWGNDYKSVALASGQFEAVTGSLDRTKLARNPDTSSNEWKKAVYIARLILDGKTADIPNKIGSGQFFYTSDWFVPRLNENYVKFVNGHYEVKVFRKDGSYYWAAIKDVQMFGGNTFFNFAN